MKYQLDYKKKKIKPGGYIGMNFFAAKSTEHYHHKKIPFRHRHPEHILEVYKKVPKHVRLDTIRHEECEEYFMKNYHYDYHKAHKLALRFEKYNVPFPKRNIKEKLKEIGLIKKK